MKKSIGKKLQKSLSVAIILFFIIGLLPQTALAASHTVSDGDTFDISTCSDGDTVTVEADATATITGNKNVKISCGSGVTLTLDSVTSKVSGTSSACALSFTGSGNTLILSGENTLSSGSREPGVHVESSTELVIKGQTDDASLTATGGAYGAGIGGGSNGIGGTITIESGTVKATGGQYAAGIGGGYESDGGTITIEGGTVTATDGDGGAGIGGGYEGDGGTITITGGTVTAIGGNSGAGIGGGHKGAGGTITIAGGIVTATSRELGGAGIGGGCLGAGGTITIAGGIVTATSREFGAGIGGGHGGDGGTIKINSGTVTTTGGSCGAGIGGGNDGGGGTITIESGTITATGGGWAAGIGGGEHGNGGTITIEGGMVYAARGDAGKVDIGAGENASGCTFTLSGGAVVFLKNDNSKTPVTESHKHFSISGPLYGFSLPSGWSDAGFYAVPYAITYDDNGGTGGGEKVIVPENGTVMPLSGSGLSKPGYSFKEWNTAADGTGTIYKTGDSITITEDITLYAIWEVDDESMISSVTPSGSGAALDGDIVITFANDMDETAAGTVTVGGETLADGTWSSSNRVYTIRYSVELFNTEYSIEISGFTDTYGTEMNSTSNSFTTKAPAELKSLSVSTGTLIFDADTAAYSVDAAGIDSIGITAETVDPLATLSINGVYAISGAAITVSLDNGANMIPVVATAQDGVQKSYIISVNGTVSNADLSSLTLSAGTLIFDTDTTSYYVTVGSDVTSVDLDASADDGKAVMLLDGAILSQGGTESIPLSVGDNTVELMVIAQDATTKTYAVTINRGSSDASLSNLTLSEGTLSPSFNPATDSYTAVVANSVSSLTVTPTSSDTTATVTVNDAAAATPVSLSVGSNTVAIEVTGSDGVTTKTYTVTVMRQAEITITNTSLPVGIIGGTYSLTLEASGGTGLFTWSATGLPDSLSIDSETGMLSGTPVDGDEAAYNITITATDENLVTGSETYTLVINQGCGGGAYLIVSDGDAAYTGSYTDEGIPTLTVNDGVSGFTYFRVNISVVTGHAGDEVCLFVHKRDGEQIGFSFNEADYDTVGKAGAAFNVQAGDVIEVYIVNALTNGTGSAPTVL